DWKNYILVLSKNFLALPYHEHITNNNGEYQKVFDRGAESIFDVGEGMLITLLPQFFIFIFLFGIGLYTNVAFTILSVVILPFGFAATLYFGNKVYVKQREVNKIWDKCFSRFNDALTNIGVVKIFAREKNEYNIQSNLFNDATEKQAKLRNIWMTLFAINKFMDLAGRMIVFGFGVFFVINKKLTIGELIMFQVIIGRIYGPVLNLLEVYQRMVKDVANFYKSQLIVSTPKEEDKGKIIFDNLKDSIKIIDLDFSYPGNKRKVLDKINLEIKKGEKVAFVGHTGSGKSTTINLINRLYDTKKGEILVDEIHIQDYTLESYRSKFAIMFQDTTIFNESILHNLEYVKDNTNMDEIKYACKEANILDFIESLERGFETEVGERGLKLSGGERQRIAIARAILKDPDILILDEPTSALDSKTESLIQKSLNKLMKGRTSIIIAHRLSTIKHADKIFLFEKGKIIASGNHEELYNSSSAYKEMVDFQKDGFLVE
ncbi:ABC transporter ATP-binding protein, partial [Candidatus Gracilibacteria bacterium]|nr:ABC transporter ATP-binding protein [Candidatus Gracilibacteria bacterium]